jgi:tetratricopeptide (TPR) repeat protein
MQEAAAASAEGSKQRSRELYATAAKNYPTSKEPWVKLAEDYFEGGNYGQAILAAQEVTQRDPADSLATSVLAVSGLRVSASALSTLRQQQTALNGGTRTEAEGLARILRDLLGEPVLVPRPTNAGAGGSSLPRARQPARPAAAGMPATSTPPPPAAVKTAPPDDPFKVLKK